LKGAFGERRLEKEGEEGREGGGERKNEEWRWIGMRKEKRRVQLTGGSTYIVSLPIKWVRELGLKKGDEVLLLRHGKKSLVLMPVGKAVQSEGGEKRRAELNISESEGFEENFRYLIALYLVGYDEIVLRAARGFNAEERKRIKAEVRKRLIGMEVVGESATEIQLQSFLKYEDFTLCDAVKSMTESVVAMLNDALLAVERGDVNLALDVIERDNEIDRFYLLIVRQLKAVISDYELAQKIGIGTPRNSLGYRIIVKSIERIADHIENIAKHAILNEKAQASEGKLQPLSISAERVREIREIGDAVREVFLKTMDALSEMDMKRSNDAIRDANAVISAVEDVNESVLSEESDATTKIHTLSILDSLARIAKYCTDIAEVTINMCIKSADEIEF